MVLVKYLDSTSTIQYNLRTTKFTNVIMQNDVKRLKKLMKSKHGKNKENLKDGLLLSYKHDFVEAMKILLSSPLVDPNEYFLFHFAIQASKNDMVDVFLSNKRVDVNAILGSGDGRTPLMVACNSSYNDGHNEIVRKLISHPDLDVNALHENTNVHALDYALMFGDAHTVRLILSHRDISHKAIRDCLARGFAAISGINIAVNRPWNLSAFDVLLKKNVENRFVLRGLVNGMSEYHEHFQSQIMEELEMKIREEYYTGNVTVSLESLSNEAFGAPVDVLQASVLKCQCIHCVTIKQIKRDLDLVAKGSDHRAAGEFSKNSNKLKCFVDKKIKFQVGLRGKVELFLLPLPDIFKQVLYKGGYEEEIENIIDGTKSASQVDEEFKAEILKIKLHENKLYKIKDGKTFAKRDLLLNNKKSAQEENMVHMRPNSSSISEKEATLKGDSIIMDNESAVPNSSSISDKEATLKGDSTIMDNESAVNTDSGKDVDNTISKIEDFKSLCWSCSVKEVKLFKCGGCFKARYCSEKCIEKDWPEHMNYCLRKQKKIKEKHTLKYPTLITTRKKQLVTRGYCTIPYPTIQNKTSLKTISKKQSTVCPVLAGLVFTLMLYILM